MAAGHFRAERVRRTVSRRRNRKAIRHIPGSHEADDCKDKPPDIRPRTRTIPRMPQNHYDKASRFAAKLDASEFFRWLLRLPREAFGFHRWLDTRGVPFPGDPDRTGDTVAHIENSSEHGVPWALAVEFQTQPDPDMFGRLLGYLSGLWLTLRPDPERGSRFHMGAAVVNLTGVGLATRDMRWPATGLTTHLGVVERNLERESASELLAGIESEHWSRCLLPWVPLLAGSDAPELVDRWKLLAEGEPNSRRRAEYGGLALVFADKADRKLLWQEKLEGWNMQESVVVNEWIAMGEKRGEARGRMELARTSVIHVGTKRFGRGPSEAQQATLDAITDITRLTELLDRALDVGSWEELLPTS